MLYVGFFFFALDIPGGLEVGAVRNKHYKLVYICNLMTRETVKGSVRLIYFSRGCAVVIVIRAKNNVVGVYFVLDSYADSDKYSLDLFRGAVSTSVSFTPMIHSLFLFPTYTP